MEEAQPAPSAAQPAPSAAQAAQGAVDIATQQVIQEQKTERILKIVFGVIVAIVVVIVVICLYSVFTQDCPSTNDNDYEPSLACAGANLINQVGNAINWVQSHFWALLLVPVGLGIGWAALKVGVAKTNFARPKAPTGGSRQPKPFVPKRK